MKTQHFLYVQKKLLLNIAGCIIFILLFLNLPNLKIIFTTHLKNENVIVTTTKAAAHEFIYIKPFTALLRFNKKNPKIVETKTSEQKITLPDFLLLRLKIF